MVSPLFSPLYPNGAAITVHSDKMLVIERAFHDIIPLILNPNGLTHIRNDRAVLCLEDYVFRLWVLKEYRHRFLFLNVCSPSVEVCLRNAPVVKHRLVNLVQIHRIYDNMPVVA